MKIYHIELLGEICNKKDFCPNPALHAKTFALFEKKLILSALKLKQEGSNMYDIFPDPAPYRVVISTTKSSAWP